MSTDHSTASQQEPHHASISLVYFDASMNETITIGGAAFMTEAEFEKAWAGVPEHAGTSSFQADHLDAQGDIVGEKTVTAQTCEALVGRPITTLIIEGRAKLQAELDGYAEERKAAGKGAP